MFGCIPCSKETKDTFNEIMDFSIFNDYVFIIFTLSNFCTSVGFNVPYVFLVPLGKSLGLETPSYLLSTIGAANTVGRIVLGYFSDKPYVNRLLVYNVCLTLCGVGESLFDYFSSIYIIILNYPQPLPCRSSARTLSPSWPTRSCLASPLAPMSV